MIIQSQPKLI